MEWQEDIRLPARGNIRVFLPRRKATELLLVMLQIDAWKTGQWSNGDEGSQDGQPAQTSQP